MRSVVAPAIVALLAVCAPVGAEFFRPMLENVPIDRLIANLDRGSREDRQLTDGELESLAIWHDRNVNGQSDAGEVRALADWQIVALSCDYDIDPTHPDEIAYSRAGVTFRDGSSCPTFDIVLHPAGRSLSQNPPRR